jgi:predicted nucleic acid-binding protein
MTVVSNTSRPSNLATIGRLDLLREQFGVVLIPEAVSRELDSLQHAAGGAAIRQALADHWLEVVAVTNPQLVRAYEERLDAGEAEAIALAFERSANLLLMDEADGRETAVAAGVRVQGALGVLRKARQTDRISSLLDELRRLRAEAHFFVDTALEQELLKAVGEE